MRAYYEHDNANPHRGAYALSVRATDATTTRASASPRSSASPMRRALIFTRGTTEAINLVATAWGRANIRSGDEIVVTGLEHHANFVPWQQLALERGAHLRICELTATGEIDLDCLRSLLNKRTRVVAFSHVSNALGTINPVQEIAALVRERCDAIVVCDGAQSAPHFPVSVRHARRRLLRLQRPQDAGSDGDRRADRTPRAPRAHAAVPDRRRHDRVRARRSHDLERAAAQVRGGDAQRRRRRRPRGGGATISTALGMASVPEHERTIARRSDQRRSPISTACALLRPAAVTPEWRRIVHRRRHPPARSRDGAGSAKACASAPGITARSRSCADSECLRRRGHRSTCIPMRATSSASPKGSCTHRRCSRRQARGRGNELVEGNLDRAQPRTQPQRLAERSHGEKGLAGFP